jgi:hypothetical protein
MKPSQQKAPPNPVSHPVTPSHLSALRIMALKSMVIRFKKVVLPARA